MNAAWAQVPPQLPISQLPSGGPMQAADLFPATRSGITYGVTWPPSNIPLSDLPSQSANVMLGTIAIGPPVALNMPSCSGTNGALTWTTGVGIGCHTVTVTSAPLSSLIGATTTDSFDNLNLAQSWTWNSLTSQTALSLSSSSATSGVVFAASLTTSGNSGYAGYFQNTATGNTGYAIYAAGNAYISKNLSLPALTTGAIQATGGAVTAGTLPVPSGGTGFTSFPPNDLIIGNGSTLSVVTSAANSVLFSSSLGVPIWGSTIPTNVQQNITQLGAVTTGTLSLSGTTTLGVLDVNGTGVFSSHVAQGGSAPTVASGASACGTSPAISGSDQVGSITVGSAPSGVCVVTFATPWSNAPDTCSCNDNTSTARTCAALSISTTSFALTATTSPFTGGDAIGYTCASHRL